MVILLFNQPFPPLFAAGFGHLGHHPIPVVRVLSCRLDQLEVDSDRFLLQNSEKPLQTLPLNQLLKSLPLLLQVIFQLFIMFRSVLLDFLELLLLYFDIFNQIV
jgi:hypothetical protein